MERDSFKKFNVEKATFEIHRAKLVENSDGKYVLIKGSEVIDVFDTENDAVRAGYRKFGLEPFFVRQVTEFDSPIHFSSTLVKI